MQETNKSDFIRARSDEHKEERMTQSKEATASLFENEPYAEITLTTIAQKLGWSRANLYKYVTTKEEIILEIASDKMTTYYTALLSAFPERNNFSLETIAEVWSLSNITPRSNLTHDKLCSRIRRIFFSPDLSVSTL